MKKATTLLLTLALYVCTTLGQTQVITMTVNSEDYTSYVFYLKAKASYTPIQVDFGDGILVNRTIDTSFTTVIGTLTQYLQNVKVYGNGITSLLCGNRNMIALDVSNNSELTELLCSNAGFKSLDVSRNVGLTRLQCSDGWLKALDVSSNTALTSLDCSNNNFSTLDVSKNALLTALNCSGNDMSALDVSRNPLLASLNCSVNQLSNLELSNNTALTYLDCSANQLSSLKVGQALTELYCHTNHLSSLDLSKNTGLKLIDCGTNELNTLDVSKCITLTMLNCAMNKLSALNVSNSRALTSLNCSNNRLLTLDVSKEAVFSYFFCEENRLSFATLPLEQASWQFTYAPQDPISIAKNLAAGIELDLSNQLTVNGNTSVYAWKTQSGATLVEGTDYIIAHGKTVFLNSQTDSIYCEITNTIFPDFTGSDVLKTTFTKVTPAYNISMTTSNAIGSVFSFGLQANAANTPIQVDFGDGAKRGYAIGTSLIEISDKLVGSQTVRVYGKGITYLSCPNIKLTTLDIGQNTALAKLNCSENNLSKLDVTKNTALSTLACGGNQLATLDLTQNTALENLDCSHNSLNVLDVTKNPVLTRLMCALNQLTALDITKNTDLVWLMCAMNQLTVLDVTKNTALTWLVCNQNQLTALDVTRNNKLTWLYCDSNRLSFSTLPLKQTTWTIYNYAPQHPIPIVTTLATGVEIDLSSQSKVNGHATVYTWKTQNGVALVEGIDYYIADGKTTFVKAQSDSVYCELANAAFSDFTGANVLKTTNTRITFGTAVADLKSDWVDVYSYYKTIFINLSYNAQLSIYDIKGRLVVCKPLNSGSTNLQLPNTGIYLVKLTKDKDVVTR